MLLMDPVLDYISQTLTEAGYDTQLTTTSVYIDGYRGQPYSFSVIISFGPQGKDEILVMLGPYTPATTIRPNIADPDLIPKIVEQCQKQLTQSSPISTKP